MFLKIYCYVFSIFLNHSVELFSGILTWMLYLSPKVKLYIIKNNFFFHIFDLLCFYYIYLKFLYDIRDTPKSWNKQSIYFIIWNNCIKLNFGRVKKIILCCHLKYGQSSLAKCREVIGQNEPSEYGLPGNLQYPAKEVSAPEQPGQVQPGTKVVIDFQAQHLESLLSYTLYQ
jgi:hypothetical protein